MCDCSHLACLSLHASLSSSSSSLASRLSWQVLYRLFESFLRMPTLTGFDVLLGAFEVLAVGTGGVLVGIFFGLVAALVTRFTARAQVIAPLFVFLFSYLCYLTSEMLHISGFFA